MRSRLYTRANLSCGPWSSFRAAFLWATTPTGNGVSRSFIAYDSNADTQRSGFGGTWKEGGRRRVRICTQSEWKLFALGVQLRIQLNLLQIAECLAF